MDRIELGNTGIVVSRLCFGSLTMTPFQANLTIEEGAYLIQYAYSKGINFLDTAEIYDNYQYIRKALEGIDREDYVLATKCYAYTKEMAEKSLNKALKELNTDYIDIFMLHEQESIHTLRGHMEAIEYFLEAKKMGKIRSIGISTHKVEGVLGAISYDEIEIIHPIVNREGIGIQDGSVNDMLIAIKKAYNKGKGIYSMKPLGGGHLISQLEEAFNFVRNIPYIHSIAIGMQSKEEVDCNTSLIETGKISSELKRVLTSRKRNLVVADYCIGCGNCKSICKHNGIDIIDGKAVPNDNCILCSYCARGCPEFCIKIV
ncbi:aldo/keto reductase [Tepidimicrobium xylanilyticum]|uniref:Aldo/keto reductase family protein n=1 Tax=Tepidimicrobium xylanilyticum TaxID=1123352 RepID=A0A1H2SIL0_9FIRM|nr:aldo/keto reductase [Tepidimicrobium xylanilyticum]GMG96203.1 aldo/keto reductase [Tepidimicrobium xylanilyticum]SDW31476.1 Aldo/keto reductase family protein [Tepidimicrobium xylanilyticum]